MLITTNFMLYYYGASYKLAPAEGTLIVANFMLYYYGASYKLALAERTFINN